MQELVLEGEFRLLPVRLVSLATSTLSSFFSHVHVTCSYMCPLLPLFSAILDESFCTSALFYVALFWLAVLLSECEV